MNLFSFIQPFSLLDIIVFGRSAGRNAGNKSKNVTVKDLTLSHVDSFKKELEDAGLNPTKLSPQLLPNYTKHPAI